MISSILNETGFWEWLKWSIIVIIWAFMAYGIFSENKWLRAFDQRATYCDEIKPLLRMQHQRNWLTAVLLCFLIIIGAADEFHRERAAPVVVTLAPSAETAQPPVAALQPSPEIASFEKAATSNTNSPAVFGDITEFNEKDSKEQAYIDWLKERYEAWFITYYYLQKCGQADAKDMTMIETTLAQKLTAAHAEPNVQANILLAAKGSYDEMYRNVTCDQAHLSASKATYDENMKQLRDVNAPTPESANSAPPAK